MSAERQDIEVIKKYNSRKQNGVSIEMPYKASGKSDNKSIQDKSISDKNIQNRNTGKRRKQAVTIVAALLLFLLYGVIFSFSNQNGEQSGGLSHMISEKCVELMNSISGKNWSGIFMENLAAYFEHPIRKLAHFTEYACMGVLVYMMWRPWKKRGRGLYLLTVLWVFTSAGGDEFHQLFIPGRYGSFADVLLDTCGGIFGMAVCVLMEKTVVKYRRG